MAQNNEIQITDVLAALGLIRSHYHKYDSIRTLRLNAIRNFARTELENGRFDSSDSAEKTIHDACTRRLNMDISEFDSLVELWLRSGSNRLENTLTTIAPYLEIEIHKFFVLGAGCEI